MFLLIFIAGPKDLSRFSLACVSVFCVLILLISLVVPFLLIWSALVGGVGNGAHFLHFIPKFPLICIYVYVRFCVTKCIQLIGAVDSGINDAVDILMFNMKDMLYKTDKLMGDMSAITAGTSSVNLDVIQILQFALILDRLIIRHVDGPE